MSNRVPNKCHDVSTDIARVPEAIAEPEWLCMLSFTYLENPNLVLKSEIQGKAQCMVWQK